MKNFSHEGDTQTFTAPGGGVVSGNFYVIGAILCCASGDADAGDPFEGVIRGVFDVVKATGQAWTEGAIVYFDDGAPNFTTTSGGNHQAGFISEAAESGAETGRVYLDGVAR